jgi:hypothetical protein
MTVEFIGHYQEPALNFYKHPPCQRPWTHNAPSHSKDIGRMAAGIDFLTWVMNDHKKEKYDQYHHKN